MFGGEKKISRSPDNKFREEETVFRKNRRHFCDDRSFVSGSSEREREMRKRTHSDNPRPFLWKGSSRSKTENEKWIETETKKSGPGKRKIFFLLRPTIFFSRSKTLKWGKIMIEFLVAFFTSVTSSKVAHFMVCKKKTFDALEKKHWKLLFLKKSWWLWVGIMLK